MFRVPPPTKLYPPLFIPVLLFVHIHSDPFLYSVQKRKADNQPVAAAAVATANARCSVMDARKSLLDAWANQPL